MEHWEGPNGMQGVPVQKKIATTLPNNFVSFSVNEAGTSFAAYGIHRADLHE